MSVFQLNQTIIWISYNLQENHPNIIIKLIRQFYFTAWWVSDQAVKIYIDEEDNRRSPPHDTTFVKHAILEHFKIKDR